MGGVRTHVIASPRASRTNESHQCSKLRGKGETLGRGAGAAKGENGVIAILATAYTNGGEHVVVLEFFVTPIILNRFSYRSIARVPIHMPFKRGDILSARHVPQPSYASRA